MALYSGTSVGTLTFIELKKTLLLWASKRLLESSGPIEQTPFISYHIVTFKLILLTFG